jgi:hypothetical protein
MTKSLNEYVVQNELENSVFFRKNRRFSSEEKSAENNYCSERSNERTLERIKIRHTFDIFKDQLESLYSIQLEDMHNKKSKKKLGEMVQVALDLYIQKRSNELTNERSKERPNEQI